MTALTSAAGKLIELIILARLEWIGLALGVIAEGQTGCRQLSCTDDSIADDVFVLEEADHRDEVASVVLVDIECVLTTCHNPVLRWR